MRKYIVSLFILLQIFVLSGCGLTFGSPADKKEATQAVTEALGYEPLFVTEKTEKSEYKLFKNNYYYEFEDKNGMTFTFSSEVEEGGLDGATFYYFYRDKVNYNRRIIPFFDEKISSLVKDYGMEYSKNNSKAETFVPDLDIFGNEIQFGGCMIYIDGFDDLVQASDLICEILEECRLPASNTGIIENDMTLSDISVQIKNENKFVRVSAFKWLYAGDQIDSSQIYTRLKKAYVELVKNDMLENDLPDGVLESTCPDHLVGRIGDRIYEQWHNSLVNDDNPERPEYQYRLLYCEPREREDYIYREAYNNLDMKIYNFIAQLGGACFFSEAEFGGDGAGFNCYLGDDIYFVGFANGFDQILIRKNGKEYYFDTSVYNVAMDEYQIYLSKEELEEVFGIKITYDLTSSNWDIEK